MYATSLIMCVTLIAVLPTRQGWVMLLEQSKKEGAENG